MDVTAIATLLLEEDPMSIYSEEDGNRDEYSHEAALIRDGLSSCQNEDGCLDLVWSVFEGAFGQLASDKAAYRSVAARIWREWQNSGSSRT